MPTLPDPVRFRGDREAGIPGTQDFVVETILATEKMDDMAATIETVVGDGSPGGDDASHATDATDATGTGSH